MKVLQTTSATRSRGSASHKRAVLAVFLLTILAMTLLPSAGAAPTINDFTIVITSQSTLWVDANKCGVAGPQAAWLSFWITNNSSGTLDDVTVEFNGFTGTDAAYFTTSTDNIRDLGSVPPSPAKEAVYFYVDYSEVCNHSQGGGTPYTGFIADYELVVKVANVPNTTFPGSVTTAELLTAAAAGLVESEFLVPDTGVWLGMILDQRVTYSFNNNSDLFFQPAAEAGVDDCLRLVNLTPESVDPGITGIPQDPDNRLWYPDADVAPSQTETGLITIRYQWEVLCLNAPQNVSPWAAAKSGQKYKYQTIGAPLTIQAAQPSMSATKTGETCVESGDEIQDYTISFTNITGQTNVPVYLKEIRDTFSDACVVVTNAFATGSEVLASNSSKWPGSGSATSGPNMFWESNYNGYGTGNNNINVKGWQIDSTGDTTLYLKFTVDFSACPDDQQYSYTNTAVGVIGQNPPGEVLVSTTPQALTILYPCSPLAVSLASFQAEAMPNHVLVSWETVSELNNQGFNIYRGATAGAPEEQLNSALIPSQAPGSAQGASYQWQDFSVSPGQTYYYWLEDVDLNGATTMHGPVSVEFLGPTAVTLSGLATDGANAPAPVGLPLAAMPAAAGMAMAAAFAFMRRRR